MIDDRSYRNYNSQQIDYLTNESPDIIPPPKWNHNWANLPTKPVSLVLNRLSETILALWELM